MARVPTLTVPQQENAPFRPVYQSAAGATPEAFGAIQARGLQRLGDQASRVGDRIAELAARQLIENNEREAKRLDVEYSRRLRTIAFGDGTPDNPGYYNTRGENALSALGSVQEQIAKARDELLSSTTNPRVREMFGMASEIRQENQLEGIFRYASKQRELANDAVSEARIAEARDDAATAWADPKLLAQSEALVRSEVMDMAERNGWADEVVASKMEAEVTAVYAAAIQNAALADVGSARQLFEAVRSKVDGVGQATLERTLQVAERAEEAERERALREAERAKKEAAQAAVDGYISAGILNQGIDLKRVATDPALAGEPGQKLMVINFARMLAKEEGEQTATEISAANTSELFRRMRLPADDPERLNDLNEAYLAFSQGMLKRADLDWLTKQFNDSRTPEGERLGQTLTKFYSGMKSQVSKSNPLLGKLDPTGDANFYAYQQYVEETLRRAKENGEDPYEYLRPGTPKYLGRSEVLEPFQRTMQESMQYMSEQMRRRARPAAPPVTPPRSGSLAPPVAADRELAAFDPTSPERRSLLEAIEQVESGGREDAVSEAGARGPMQIMPETARDPGFGIAPIGDGIDDPETNRRFGAEYFDAMMLKYEGDTDKALAAYNAGPGAVDRAVRDHGEDWLAAMPQETQEYLPRVYAAMGEQDANLPLPPAPDTLGGEFSSLEQLQEALAAGRISRQEAIDIGRRRGWVE